MSKRNQRETRSSSSSSSQYQPSPKRLLRDGTPGKDDHHVSLGNIMDKLCHLESRKEDLLGSLKSELSCLRHELNEEIEKVKSTVNDMETSLNAAWDTIKDLQDELKIHAEFRKKHKESLEKHLEDNGVSQSAKAKIALQESQINLSNTKLSEEQEKIIALENYSRRENLRFMNIPEQEHENCTDTVYDIVENGLNINTQNIYFHAVHRVGKPRSPEDSHHHPRPIIARFLCREDRDRVFKAKGRLRHSTDYPDAYITKDYAKAIQLERKELIKAMFIARKKGMSAKVVDRNLVINDNVYHVGNIPDELKHAAESTRS